MSVPIYRIKDWSDHYEISQTKKTRKDGRPVLWNFVPMPNKHDSLGWRTLMSHPNAGNIYTAFKIMVDVASNCEPRGDLIRGGEPITPSQLSIMSGFPVEHFEAAIPVLMSKDVGWLECIGGADGMHSECIPNAFNPEKKRKEKKRKENTPVPSEGDGLFLDMIPESLKTAEFIAVWRDWADYRREDRKKKLTARSVKAQMEGLAAMGLPAAIARLKTAIANKWQGCVFSDDWNGDGQSRRPARQPGPTPAYTPPDDGYMDEKWRGNGKQ